MFTSKLVNIGRLGSVCNSPAAFLQPIQSNFFYSTKPEIKHVHPDLAVEKLCNKFEAVILDIRPQDVIESVEIRPRVDETVTIPLSELEKRFEEIPKAKSVYVMCETGYYSPRAAEFLKSKDYKVTVIDGGFLKWALYNNPVAIPDPAKLVKFMNESRSSDDQLGVEDLKHNILDPVMEAKWRPFRIHQFY